MKTEEVLDKYRKILSGILKCKEEEIRFFIGDGVIAGQDMNKLSNLLKFKGLSNTIREIKEIEYFEPEKKDGEETGRQIRQTYWNNWSEGNYQVFVGEDRLSTFELYKMPHCCAILVSCKAFVIEKFRNKRIGTILNSFRQDIGRLLGYSLLMCTDIQQNICQRKLLATNGWKDIYDIVNKRTKNRVYISVINL